MSSVPRFLAPSITPLPLPEPTRPDARLAYAMALLDASRDILLMLDHAGHIQHANQAWTAHTGHTTARATGEQLARFLAPDDALAISTAIAEIAASQAKPITAQVRILTASGDLKWATLSLGPFMTPGATSPDLLATLRLLDGAHCGASSLNALSPLLQKITQPALIVDLHMPGYHILHANQAAEKLFGLNLSELRAHELLAFVTDSSRPLRDIPASLPDNGEDWSSNVTLVLSGSRTIQQKLLISAVPEPVGGRPHRALCVLAPQQEKPAAESPLFKWLNRLEIIFTLSPDGFISFDSTGHLNFVNPAAERMFGLNAGELMGITEQAFEQKIAPLCNDKDPYVPVEASRFLGEATDNTGTPQVDDTLLWLKQPAARTLLRSVRICNRHDSALVYYFRDVTREAQVDRLKSDFLSTAAHELRTPMASIFGFSELLIHREFERDQMRELLATINRHAQRMRDLLNDLLDLARIEARQGIDFRFKEADLGQVTAELVHGFIMPGDERSVLFTPDTQARRVRMDSARFQQALLNILSNAFKYSPEGGAVEVTLCQRTSNGRVEHGVSVRDHGIGMSAADAALVFERFFRADNSGEIPGTGLGMALAKQIMEVHKGGVELHTELGVGTTVTLWIPASDQKQDIRQDTEPCERGEA